MKLRYLTVLILVPFILSSCGRPAEEPAPTPSPTPTTFTTTNLSITPTEVNTGETVTIDLLVTNNDNFIGISKVTLKLNNVVVATEEVILASGASQKVAFTTAQDANGTYAVSIDGLSGTFVVKAPTVPAPILTTAIDYTGTYDIELPVFGTVIIVISQSDAVVIFSLKGWDGSTLAEGTGTINGNNMTLAGQLTIQGGAKTSLDITFSDDGESFSGTIS